MEKKRTAIYIRCDLFFLENKNEMNYKKKTMIENAVKLKINNENIIFTCDESFFLHEHKKKNTVKM